MLALINTNAQADAPKTAADREPHIIAPKSGRFEDVLAEELSADRFCYQSDMACLLPLLCDMGLGRTDMPSKNARCKSVRMRRQCCVG